MLTTSEQFRTDIVSTVMSSFLKYFKAAIGDVLFSLMDTSGAWQRELVTSTPKLELRVELVVRAEAYPLTLNAPNLLQKEKQC